jgi:murein DD-endopeptidase MepM/ murein hydrolase activator NlpD
MLSKISIICLSVILIMGCSREEPPSEVIYARPLNPYHVVKKGETTLKIAQKYGMDEDELIKINKLKAPYNLVPGQRLLVHAKATLQPPSAASESSQDNDVLVQPIVATAASAAGAATAVMPSGNEHAHPNTSDLSVVGSTASQTPVPPSSGGYEWPVQGEIIQQFGQKAPDGSINEGINIRAAANLPVKAIADGVVNIAGAPNPGYGNMIVIKHNDGKISVYAHLSEIIVKQSERVSKGQIIGRIGDTGMVKGNHQLYLHVRNAKSKPIDPLTLLP